VILIAADVTVPSTAAANAQQPTPTGSAAPTVSAAPTGSTTTNPSGFNAVDNNTQMQSGEALLVEAYIAIWVLLFGFIVLAWLRTRKVEDKVAELEKAIERAKTTAPIPTTRRSASEPPPEVEKA